MAGVVDKRLDELRDRLGRVEAVQNPRPVPDVLEGTFEQQRAFILDNESPFLAVLATRRAAKSYSLLLKYVHLGLQHPGSNFVIGGLSAGDLSRNYIRDIIYPIDSAFDLRGVVNHGSLCYTLPNASRIYLIGIDAQSQRPEVLRGMKLRGAALDECQSIKNADCEDLIFNVLKPACADLRGQICLLGTPSNNLASYFHSVTKLCRGSGAGYVSPESARAKGWKVMAWGAQVNPYMREQWAADIADFRARFGESYEQVPRFRQAYLGEWVVDQSALVYHGFDPERNSIAELPAPESGDEWRHIVSCDLGFRDQTAFAVGCYRDHSPIWYLIHTWAAVGLDFDDVAARLKWYQFRYAPEALVIDGSNRQGVETLRKRWQLPLVNTEKRDKAEVIASLNAAFLSQRAMVLAADCANGIPDPDGKQTLSLVEQLQTDVWDSTKQELGKFVEDPSCVQHIADAALYNFRYAYGFLYKKPFVGDPPPITPEETAEGMWQNEIAEVQAMTHFRVVNVAGRRFTLTGEPRGWDDDGDADPMLTGIPPTLH